MVATQFSMVVLVQASYLWRCRRHWVSLNWRVTNLGLRRRLATIWRVRSSSRRVCLNEGSCLHWVRGVLVLLGRVLLLSKLRLSRVSWLRVASSGCLVGWRRGLLRVAIAGWLLVRGIGGWWLLCW